FDARDVTALSALGLDAAKDAGKTADTARAPDNGRRLFLGKSRCSTCHTGENFTDYRFHNLGVGVRAGVLPPEPLGPLPAQPAGGKDLALAGAFKTPPLRYLPDTAPYLHDGGEATLEKVSTSTTAAATPTPTWTSTSATSRPRRRTC